VRDDNFDIVMDEEAWEALPEEERDEIRLAMVDRIATLSTHKGFAWGFASASVLYTLVILTVRLLEYYAII
jgi:transposase